MKSQILGPEVILGGLVGLVAQLLDIDWTLLWAFVLVLIIDLLSGAIIALIQGTFRSRVLRIGAMKKALEVIIVTLLLVVNVAIQRMGINLPLGSIIIGAFLIKDVVSILENYAKVGKVPPIVLDWLDKIKIHISPKTSELEGDKSA